MKSMLIRDLEIGARVRNALEGLGAVLLQDACNFTAQDILMQKGAGDTTLNEVRRTLAPFGLFLKGEGVSEMCKIPEPPFSLWDYFAAAALQGLLSNSNFVRAPSNVERDGTTTEEDPWYEPGTEMSHDGGDGEHIADHAANLADAMIERRKQSIERSNNEKALTKPESGV